jgi:hypothetical protein
MPVTAKLSRKFYDTFGDEIANELVGWFNSVDDAYRSEFRDLFDVHFARLDAKLDQRVAQLDAKLEQRVAALEAKVEQRLAEVKAELMKWMFIYWAGSVVTTAGLVLAAVGLLRR